MLKKSFFGLSKPCFYYKSLNFPALKQVSIPIPKRVTLHLEKPLTKTINDGVKVGDKVKTGQKILLSKTDNIYTISSVTGTVEAIAPVSLDYGASHTAIRIKLSGQDRFDDSFKKESDNVNLDTIGEFLSCCPGKPPTRQLSDRVNPVKSVLLYGGDSDLYSNFGLRFMIEKSDMVNKGIKCLKKAGVNNVMLVVPQDSIQGYSGHFDATIKTVSNEYPHAQPLMIVRELVEESSNNICIMKLEAITSIGQSFKEKMLPVEKTVVVIDKKLKEYGINVRVGTHIGHILDSLDISVDDRDKIIFGGPMTGSAIYSLDHPVLPNTETIVVQDRKDIPYYTDYSCINCGECVRICPARIPVNLLTRFLSAGQYEEGAASYDLHSCVECGLCSCVCVSRIPIFQYIKLAKYEIDRIGGEEETNE